MRCKRAGRQAGLIGGRAAVLSLALLAGCAMPGPAEREAAEYARVDSHLRATEELRSFSRRCRAAGGTVYVSGSWGRLRPSPADVRTPSCVAASSGLR